MYVISVNEGKIIATQWCCIPQQTKTIDFIFAIYENEKKKNKKTHTIFYNHDDLIKVCLIRRRLELGWMRRKIVKKSQRITQKQKL